MKQFSTLFALVMATASLQAARGQAQCAPVPPAACNEDACCRTYCLGPENYAVNAPVNPVTCNGDWVITLAGFYWNFHQDSMEFAIKNSILETDWNGSEQFIDADYIVPKSSWDFGFKLGVGYNTTCDGWDFGVLWTRYCGNSHTHVEAETEDNQILLALWSYMDDSGPENTFPVVTDLTAKWKVNLNLVDVSLGRKFWNGHRLSLHPFIGFRYVSIKQNYDLLAKGGDFTSEFVTPVNNEVDVDNDFHGFGARAGLDSVFNLGCGWGIYGDLAFSLVYGRFDIDHDEQNREAETPFAKTKVLELERSFRAVRYIADIGIGIEWFSLVCNCNYGVGVRLGWEAHLFFDQNQMIRQVHDSGDIMITPLSGNLDTQGWTLSATLDF